MKIFIQKLIINNKAPFDSIDLDFNDNEISVLTAINGSGKTTILSHIVDAWHEMAKPYFSNEYEGKSNKYYRLSSGLDNLSSKKPSFIYVRFKVDDGFVDYLEIRSICTEQEYENAILLNDKIPFENVRKKLERSKHVKILSKTLTKQVAEAVFNNNLITYFPSYRFELPGYLNDPYKIKIDFSKVNGYTGFLNNKIEVVSGLPDLANWIMDVILDFRAADASSPEETLLQNLNKILTHTLSSKKLGSLRLGVGPRGYGSTRIQILSESKTVYPTIFSLSSGEASVLSLFGTLLRHADNNKTSNELSEITGIVLIDEVDKYLHIKLQKEVLPELFMLFPNVQFILSSHSPFLSMGLAEVASHRARIIDLDNFGISVDPITNDLYTEVYDIMISENDKFKQKYINLASSLSDNSKPLIITEGKTDVLHLKRAYEILAIEDCDIDFYEINEDWGDSNLKYLLEQLAKIQQSRKIIGIFDRDDVVMVSDIEKGGVQFKNYLNNVFAFCLPQVNAELYGTAISIEHYYPKEVLLKKDSSGRRLFLGNEFHESGNSKTGAFQTRISKIQHKVKVNGIIDEKVYEKTDLEQKQSVAMSKVNFAKTVTTDEAFCNNEEFKVFETVFERIKAIINYGAAPTT